MSRIFLLFSFGQLQDQLRATLIWLFQPHTSFFVEARFQVRGFSRIWHETKTSLTTLMMWSEMKSPGGQCTILTKGRECRVEHFLFEKKRKENKECRKAPNQVFATFLPLATSKASISTLSLSTFFIFIPRCSYFRLDSWRRLFGLVDHQTAFGCVA